MACVEKEFRKYNFLVVNQFLLCWVVLMDVVNVSGVALLLGKKGLVRSLFWSKNSVLEVVILLFRNYPHVMFWELAVLNKVGLVHRLSHLGNLLNLLVENGRKTVSIF